MTEEVDVIVGSVAVRPGASAGFRLGLCHLRPGHGLAGSKQKATKDKQGRFGRRSVLLPRLVFGSLIGSGAQLAVDFGLIDRRQELVQKEVCSLDFQDVVRGQKRRKSLLPEVMASFDLPLACGAGAYLRSAP